MYPNSTDVTAALLSSCAKKKKKKNRKWKKNDRVVMPKPDKSQGMTPHCLAGPVMEGLLHMFAEGLKLDDV